MSLMVDGAAAMPAPIGLGGIINKLTTDPAAEVPTSESYCDCEIHRQ